MNRLSVDSVEENSFALLTNLQVLDIGQGDSGLPFKKDHLTGEEGDVEEEEET